MSDGVIGHGSKLAYKGRTETTATSNYTTIGNIINIGGPDQTRASVDISTMDSPAKWMEFIPGLLDAGEITCELNYDGTFEHTSDTSVQGYATLLQDRMTAGVEGWKIIVPKMDGSGDTTSVFSKFEINGFVTGLGTQDPHDDKITQSVTIKLTGPVVFDDENS